MWFFALLFLCRASCPPRKVKIIFVIDASGSVYDLQGGWPSQLQLANTMLNSVRDKYREADLDVESHLAWGALKFAQKYDTIRPLAAYEGKSDTIPLSTPGVCNRQIPTFSDVAHCSTEYEPVLTKAKAMLDSGFEDYIPMIWFLTDGNPWDYEPYLTDDTVTTQVTAESLRSFAQKRLPDVNMVCAYLTPKSVGLQAGEDNLRELCGDSVIAANQDSPDFNLARFTQQAKKMFDDEVSESVFACEPVIWVTIALVILIIIGLIVLAMGGRKVKKYYFNEEEGAMVDVATRPSRTRASPSKAHSRRRQYMDFSCAHLRNKKCGKPSTHCPLSE